MANLNTTSLTRRSVLRSGGTIALGGGGIVLLQACGGTTQETGQETGPTVTRIPVTIPPAATAPPAMETTEAPGVAESPAAGGILVEMNDQLKFVPDQLTCNVGEPVTWRVVGAIPHTSTCDPAKAQRPENAKLPEGAATWDSGMLNQGQEFSHTFDVAGDYTYFCIPHELMGMVATITVAA